MGGKCITYTQYPQKQEEGIRSTATGVQAVTSSLVGAGN